VGIQSERFRDRLQALAEDEWGSQPAAIIECDVGDDEELLRAGTEVADAFPSGLDILVHSIAFATAHGIQSPMIDCTREDFRVAHDISAYSLVGMTRSMLPALETSATASKSSSNQRGAPLVLALSYFGAERAVPHYGIMGPAKASLEATMRGLAAELGPRGIRVNCLSPGTVQTLAARGIPGFQVRSCCSQALRCSWLACRFALVFGSGSKARASRTQDAEAVLCAPGCSRRHPQLCLFACVRFVTRRTCTARQPQRLQGRTCPMQWMWAK
jgi:enoyl-[acyl-carrier-protein] reductase (NADH)